MSILIKKIFINLFIFLLLFIQTNNGLSNETNKTLTGTWLSYDLLEEENKKFLKEFVIIQDELYFNVVFKDSLDKKQYFYLNKHFYFSDKDKNESGEINEDSNKILLMQTNKTKNLEKIFLWEKKSDSTSLDRNKGSLILQGTLCNKDINIDSKSVYATTKIINKEGKKNKSLILFCNYSQNDYLSFYIKNLDMLEENKAYDVLKDNINIEMIINTKTENYCKNEKSVFSTTDPNQNPSGLININSHKDNKISITYNLNFYNETNFIGVIDISY